MTTTNYLVRRYNDGKQIGEANLTANQFAHYEAISQKPQGLIRLGAMPHDYYDLAYEFQDSHEDTAIYLD